MHSQPSQDKHQENLQGAFSWISVLALSHATCLVVFTRVRFGTHFFGLNGLLAFLGILVYAGIAHSPEMFAFFPVWLVALIIQRIWSTLAARGGPREHSRYSGQPLLAMIVPVRRSELLAKCFLEPFLCFLIGGVVMPASQALGSFILVGGFSLLITAAIDQEIGNVRLRAMRDAEIEQRQLVERFRGQRDD